MVMTFLNTACDEEIATAYDVFVGEPLHTLEFDDDVDDDLAEAIMGADEDDPYIVKYSDDEMLMVRRILFEVISNDFKGDLTFIPDFVDWVYGLSFVEVAERGDQFVFMFDDGMYDE